MVQRKHSAPPTFKPRPRPAGDEEITAKALTSILRESGATFPKVTLEQLIRNNPVILKRLAKFFVQQCFRNTVIEDYHADGRPRSSKGSRITQAEMKALMIEAVDKTYSFLWALFHENIGTAVLSSFDQVDPVGEWNEPKFEPTFAVGLIGIMRLFALGSETWADAKEESKRVGAKAIRRKKTVELGVVRPK
jgi:hypothetical protein